MQSERTENNNYSQVFYPAQGRLHGVSQADLLEQQQSDERTGRGLPFQQVSDHFCGTREELYVPAQLECFVEAGFIINGGGKCAKQPRHKLTFLNDRLQETPDDFQASKFFSTLQQQDMNGFQGLHRNSVSEHNSSVDSFNEAIKQGVSQIIDEDKQDLMMQSKDNGNSQNRSMSSNDSQGARNLQNNSQQRTNQFAQLMYAQQRSKCASETCTKENYQQESHEDGFISQNGVFSHEGGQVLSRENQPTQKRDNQSHNPESTYEPFEVQRRELASQEGGLFDKSNQLDENRRNSQARKNAGMGYGGDAHEQKNPRYFESEIRKPDSSDQNQLYSMSGYQQAPMQPFNQSNIFTYQKQQMTQHPQSNHGGQSSLYSYNFMPSEFHMSVLSPNQDQSQQLVYQSMAGNSNAAMSNYQLNQQQSSFSKHHQQHFAIPQRQQASYGQQADFTGEEFSPQMLSPPHSQNQLGQRNQFGVLSSGSEFRDKVSGITGIERIGNSNSYDDAETHHESQHKSNQATGPGGLPYESSIHSEVQSTPKKNSLSENMCLHLQSESQMANTNSAATIKTQASINQSKHHQSPSTQMQDQTLFGSLYTPESANQMMQNRHFMLQDKSICKQLFDQPNYLAQQPGGSGDTYLNRIEQQQIMTASQVAQHGQTVYNDQRLLNNQYLPYTASRPLVDDHHPIRKRENFQGPKEFPLSQYQPKGHQIYNIGDINHVNQINDPNSNHKACQPSAMVNNVHIREFRPQHQMQQVQYQQQILPNNTYKSVAPSLNSQQVQQMRQQFAAFSINDTYNGECPNSFTTSNEQNQFSCSDACDNYTEWIGTRLEQTSNMSAPVPKKRGKTKQGWSEAGSRHVVDQAAGQQMIPNSKDETQEDRFSMELIQRLDNAKEVVSTERKMELLHNNVARLAQTQSGSRYLQKILTKAKIGMIDFILTDIGKQFSHIMVDSYGNYFCQMLLSSCSGEQRVTILQLIQQDFIRICVDKRGTHTIQTILDTLSIPEEEKLIKNCLRGHVFTLSLDDQGTHVIQKLLRCGHFEKGHNFVRQEIIKNMTDLCVNRNGLCVIKILVSKTKDPVQQQTLMNRIQNDILTLVCHQFGNYSISAIVINWPTKICQTIFDQLRNKLSGLSMQKYSSNVIEHCLVKSDQETKSLFMQEISQSEQLANLIKNQYGNYVVQKALRISTGADRQMLSQAIQDSMPEIKEKKIRSKWEEILQKSSWNNYDYSESNSIDVESQQSYPRSGNQRHNGGNRGRLSNTANRGQNVSSNQSYQSQWDHSQSSNQKNTSQGGAGRYSTHGKQQQYQRKAKAPTKVVPVVKRDKITYREDYPLDDGEK